MRCEALLRPPDSCARPRSGYVSRMRGYFGIGVEGASKPMNVGSLFRAAHGFGASFVFTIDAQYPRRETQRADTSHANSQVPVYEFESLDALRLPRECQLVGIELIEGAGPSAQLPPSPPRGLRAGAGTGQPVARAARALRPFGQNPDIVRDQSGDGRRHRDV